MENSYKYTECQKIKDCFNFYTFQHLLFKLALFVYGKKVKAKINPVENVVDKWFILFKFIQNFGLKLFDSVGLKI